MAVEIITDIKTFFFVSLGEVNESKVLPLGWYTPQSLLIPLLEQGQNHLVAHLLDGCSDADITSFWAHTVFLNVIRPLIAAGNNDLDVIFAYRRDYLEQAKRRRGNVVFDAVFDLQLYFIYIAHADRLAVIVHANI